MIVAPVTLVGAQRSIDSEFPPVIEGKTQQVFADKSSHPAFLWRVQLAVELYARDPLTRAASASSMSRRGPPCRAAKGGGEQYLPLTREARHALRDWLKVRQPVKASAVFFRIPYQPTRSRLVYQSVEKMLKKYAATAGVTIPKGISFNLLRHTAGQRMSDIGLGIEEAQRVLGHRTSRTTQVYYQVGDKRLRKAIRRLRY